LRSQRKKSKKKEEKNVENRVENDVENQHSQFYDPTHLYSFALVTGYYRGQSLFYSLQNLER
jgi:hypothetical protein